MESKGKILIAGETEAEAAMISSVVKACGYAVQGVEPDESAVTMAALYIPDLLLLGTGTPDNSSLDTLFELRKWSEMPIIVLSQSRSESELVRFLDGGANDYIAKPFSKNEMAARIRAAIRTHRRAGLSPDSASYRNGVLEIDYGKRTVAVGGRAVHLTPNEYKIIVLFSQNTGRVLSHDYIIHRLWGEYVGDSQLLRVNVANIRQKIESNPATPEFIITEVGVGYRMREYEQAR